MDRERVLELFDRYGDMVYRVALGYLRSSQEAEDAVQTVFLKLLEGAGSPWPGRADTPLEELDLPAPPEDQEVFRAVMDLPEKYRLAVTLHCFEGYTFQEIARLLHIGPSAVSMRVHRAKTILKQQLGREE